MVIAVKARHGEQVLFLVRVGSLVAVSLVVIGLVAIVLSFRHDIGVVLILFFVGTGRSIQAQVIGVHVLTVHELPCRQSRLRHLIEVDGFGLRQVHDGHRRLGAHRLGEAVQVQEVKHFIVGVDEQGAAVVLAGDGELGVRVLLHLVVDAFLAQLGEDAGEEGGVFVQRHIGDVAAVDKIQGHFTLVGIVVGIELIQVGEGSGLHGVGYGDFFNRLRGRLRCLCQGGRGHQQQRKHQCQQLCQFHGVSSFFALE